MLIDYIAIKNHILETLMELDGICDVEIHSMNSCTNDDGKHIISVVMWIKVDSTISIIEINKEITHLSRCYDCVLLPVVFAAHVDEDEPQYILLSNIFYTPQIPTTKRQTPAL